MSKLAKALRLNTERERVNLMQKLGNFGSITEVTETYTPTGIGTQYTLGVNFNVDLIIDGYSDKQYEIEKAKQYIIESVYGEFREPLYKIRTMTYDSEVNKMIDDLMDQMFSK